MKLPKHVLALAFVLGLIVVTDAPVQAQDDVTRDPTIATTGPTCPGTTVSLTFDDAGDVFVFDVEGAGTVKVSTMDCCIPGDRWRATIVKVGVDGAQSRLGSGSTTNFSGEITRQISSLYLYRVLISWDEQLPVSVSPSGMDVCFETTGSVVVTGPLPE